MPVARTSVNASIAMTQSLSGTINNLHLTLVYRWQTSSREIRTYKVFSEESAKAAHVSVILAAIWGQ